MKNILLPTDFSNNSLNAIQYAVALFKVEICHFHILNIQKTSSFISDDLIRVSATNTIYDTIVKAAQMSIHNIILGVKNMHDNPKHTFSAIVDYDNFTDSINQIIETRHIDLIVMGTKGATGLKQVFFGSNTVKVMQRCRVPVLAIPENYKFAQIKQTAIATSFKGEYSSGDLKPCKDIIALTNSEIKVLHVFYKENVAEELNTGVDFFNSNFSKIKFDYLKLNDDNIQKALKAYIKNNKIGLMVMMKKPSAFANRLLSKGMVENFAFSLPIPFLVIPKTIM
ncbi:MAG: universal stress protein [Flavobacteriaceae bacterium]